MRVYKDVNRNLLCPKLIGTLELINRDPCSRHYKKRYLLFQKLSLVCLISASARHKGRKFTTIAKNQWFFQFWGPMVHDGYWKGAFNNTFFLNKKINIRDKMRVYKDVKNRNALCPKLIGTSELINTQVDINQGTSCSWHSKEIFNFPETVIGLFDICFRHRGRKFTNIAKNQWF